MFASKPTTTERFPTGIPVRVVSPGSSLTRLLLSKATIVRQDCDEIGSRAIKERRSGQITSAGSLRHQSQAAKQRTSCAMVDWRDAEAPRHRHEIIRYEGLCISA